MILLLLLAAAVAAGTATLTAQEADKASDDVVTLKARDVYHHKGDGPDGKGNTADDTWQFWFELAHAKRRYARLSLHTATMSAQQKAKGIRRKITGPIASWLPNPKDTEGWIYKSDWDGRFEGIWGDKKAKQVIMYPYVEKGSHGSVALSYKVPATGSYTVWGKVTDLKVAPQFRQHDGFTWKIEVADGAKVGKAIKKWGPIGDGKGRPDSMNFKVEKLSVEKGKLIRFVCHPNKWWGSDMTKVELKIKREK